MAGGWEALVARHPATLVPTASGALSCRRAGEGPELVLLHGIGSGSGSWVHQLDGLGARFRITAWDAPGYGESEAPAEPGIDHYCDRLRALLDALGIERCRLVGHSLGALIAARYTVREPGRVERLLLASPARGYGRLDPTEAQRRLRERIDRFTALGAEAHAAERAPRLLSPRATPQQQALVRWNMARLRADGYPAAARALAAGRLDDDAARIACPVHVVVGAEDGITTPDSCRELARAFRPPCAFDEIPGAGHACYVEQPGRFDALAAGFLAA